MSTPPMPQDKCETPPGGLNRAALATALREMERTTALLRRQLQAAEDRDKREAGVKQHFQALAAAGQAALQLERDGIERTCAARRIAQVSGFPEASVIYWQDHARRAVDPEARARRDREALRLAALGHTNPAIADRLGISTRSVTRIIQAAYRTPK